MPTRGALITVFRPHGFTPTLVTDRRIVAVEIRRAGTFLQWGALVILAPKAGWTFIGSAIAIVILLI